LLAVGQLRLVSSSLPRFLIATCAACANLCNNQGNIEMTRRRLPERADAKDHAIVFPSLLVDLQHRNAGSGARQSGLEAAARFFAAKAMRNRNHKGC